MMPADWISISYVGSSLDEGKDLGLVKGYTVEWRGGIDSCWAKGWQVRLCTSSIQTASPRSEGFNIVPHTAAGSLQAEAMAGDGLRLVGS